jgi:AraC family transcriptional regulator of adaptative response/methylated-DNA-[protein]-cysteine methyltransferase
MNLTTSQAELNYQRIERAIRYLDAHATEQPDLEAVAADVGLSAQHLQRVFTEWAGVSPKRFLQCLTAEHLKAAITAVPTLAGAAESVGLQGANRAYELMLHIEAVAPETYKSHGKGLRIDYAVVNSPFGRALLATTGRGITDVQFVEHEVEGSEAALLEFFHARWANAERVESPTALAALGEQVFQLKREGTGKLNLLVAGTNFQLKVWQALIRVPEGRLIGYQALAAAIGQPEASRAVGTAVGANPIGYLIPCHRVIRATGVIGGYRWGTARKKALIGYEQCHRADASISQQQSALFV